MKKEEIRRLLKKYQAGTCTPQELAVLESWYLSYNNDVESGLPDEELEYEIDLIWANVEERIKTVDAKKRTIAWRRWSAVAAVLLIVGTWSVFVFVDKEQQPVPVANVPVDIEPGENRATLTLANGTSVVLSSEQEGIVVSSDAFRYMDGSELQVEKANKPLQLTAVNSINVPRGGQYRIELPDGTNVWLNASSSMRYPASFTGTKRRVSVEGEAYFEVAPNQKKPFIVQTNGNSVQVLGTSFTVSSYPEESEARITLVSGSVKVGSLTSISDGKAVVLKPGQQAVIQADQIDVAEVDTELYTAWIANIFKFRETELRVIMGQLSRWYDIEVEYAGNIPPTYFYGQIGRDNSLSAALRILKGSGLNFEIQKTERSQKLIIYP